MANYNEPTIELIKTRMRRLMVREPGISGRRMARLLGYDRDFIHKLKKRIRRELLVGLDRELVINDLIELENIYRSMAIDMYEIVASGSKDRDKIKAFGALLNAKDQLIRQKATFGIYRK